MAGLRWIEVLNAGVPSANEKALGEPIMLGINKACLEAPAIPALKSKWGRLPCLSTADVNPWHPLPVAMGPTCLIGGCGKGRLSRNRLWRLAGSWLLPSVTMTRLPAGPRSDPSTSSRSIRLVWKPSAAPTSTTLITGGCVSRGCYWHCSLFWTSISLDVAPAVQGATRLGLSWHRGSQRHSQETHV